MREDQGGGTIVSDNSGTAVADGELFRTRLEVLRSAWADVLDRRIGDDDNYYDVGGDSMTALTIIALAEAAGVRCTARQLFTTGSLKELARVVDTHRPSAPARSAPAPAGPVEVPLSPIPRWFFDQEFEAPEHWHQCILLRVPVSGLEPFARAFATVTEQHEAFAFRYEQMVTGWRQWFEPEAERVCWITEFSDSAWTVERMARRMSTGPVPSLTHGPLAQMATFSDPGDQAGVVLSAHHLIIDVMSWNIILRQVGEELERTAPVTVAEHPASGTYGAWSAGLWRTAFDAPGASPTQHGMDPVAGEKVLPAGTEAEAGEVSTSVTVPEPALAGARHQGGVRFLEPLLVAALARALAADVQGEVRIDVEHHGRDHDGGMDLSNAVGWFTAVRPVVIAEPRAVDVATLAGRLRRWLDAQDPQAYGVNRFRERPSPGDRPPRAHAVVNLLGSAANIFGAGAAAPASSPRLRPLPFPSGCGRAPANRRPHAVELFAEVVQGTLKVSMIYNSSRWTPDHADGVLRSVVDDFLGAVPPVES
jgi:hypothetical protein